jgi:peptidoglycan/xylan/chitin deacetylase (PgdA/CDA1 family)
LAKAIDRMTSLRKLLRQTAYRTGVLSMARAGVRHALTAVMLHRVMDPSDPDFAQADPVYTVSAPLFEQLLGFFQDHYAVVDIHRVMDASDGVRALPDHALLITFDDGWADNLRYAAPLLKARGMPAVIFVAAEAVQASSPAWWQEEVFAVSRSGGLADWLAQHRNQARVMGTASNGAADDAIDVVTRLALMDAGARESILASLPRKPCHARMMLTTDELRRLTDFGIAVGLHGYRHVPLTSLTDAAAELANAREALAGLSAGAAVTTALGCPHGRYDDKVIAAARAVGIKLIFTSDKVLNATQQGMLGPARPLGRIGIAAAQIESAPNCLDPAAASRWLWPRDCR